MQTDLEAVLENLKELGDEKYKEGLSRFGIPNVEALGVKMPAIRALGKTIGKNQVLAELLWKEPYHECKLLATLVANPKEFSEELANEWVKDIYSWDVCDQWCSNLLGRTQFAWDLPFKWVPDEREFVRRAGFVVLISLRIRDKKAPANAFEKFYPLLYEYAHDERNFVKKAVNWVIRDLGKTSVYRHSQMLELCAKITEIDSAAARWIAADALRELQSAAILKRLDL